LRRIIRLDEFRVSIESAVMFKLLNLSTWRVARASRSAIIDSTRNRKSYKNG
jgi:hypothetical protein